LKEKTSYAESVRARYEADLLRYRELRAAGNRRSAQFLLQYLVDLGGIGLTLGGLHHLATSELNAFSLPPM